MSTLTDSRNIKIYAAPVTAFLGFLALGALVAARPLAVLTILAALTVLGLCVAGLSSLGHSSLSVWHILALTALSGYVLLSYGFANLAYRLGGVPIIFGHMLMFGALGLAVLSHGRTAIRAMKDPPMLCLLGLILLAVPHLVLNIPRYGLYAVRDASMFFEGIFLLLGLLWATDRRNTIPLLKWLLFIFVVNLIYSYSFPWAERLSAWSPHSGIFLDVPLFGHFTHTYLYLLSGALFCLWVGRYVAHWPAWVWRILAVCQLFALAIHQARSMYLGIVVVLFFLVLIREIRKVAGLAGMVSFGLLAVLFLTSVVGVEISGRIGPVNLSFLEAHVRSLVLQPGTPATGSIEERQEWYADVWKRAQSSPLNFLVGEGFGEPLTEAQLTEGTIVRQPHNSHLSILARLGVLGLGIWAIFHFLVVRRFFHALRRRRRVGQRKGVVILWFFLFYLLAMITTTVQPLLEFSYGAIPFYFLLGFALGFMRWQLCEMNSVNTC